MGFAMHQRAPQGRRDIWIEQGEKERVRDDVVVQAQKTAVSQLGHPACRPSRRLVGTMVLGGSLRTPAAVGKKIGHRPGARERAPEKSWLRAVLRAWLESWTETKGWPLW